MVKFISILLILTGICLGAGGGLAYEIFRANYPEIKNYSKLAVFVEDHLKSNPERPEEQLEFEVVEFKKPFIVPVIVNGQLQSLISLSLGVEVEPEYSLVLEHMKPKMRDLFLQIMFQHANAGAFSGVYTETERLAALRKNLLQIIEANIEFGVRDLFITDVARQEVS